MAKGRKKTSDAEKRLRGTDQPCRMDGSVPAVAAPATALPKAKGLKGTPRRCTPSWGRNWPASVFWIPEEKMLEKIRKENINYDLWVKAGLVKVTSGNVVDYDFVKADILGIIEDYDFQSTAYDRWNSIIDL